MPTARNLINLKVAVLAGVALVAGILSIWLMAREPVFSEHKNLTRDLTIEKSSQKGKIFSLSWLRIQKYLRFTFLCLARTVGRGGLTFLSPRNVTLLCLWALTRISQLPQVFQMHNEFRGAP